MKIQYTYLPPTGRIYATVRCTVPAIALNIQPSHCFTTCLMILDQIIATYKAVNVYKHYIQFVYPRVHSSLKTILKATLYPLCLAHFFDPMCIEITRKCIHNRILYYVSNLCVNDDHIAKLVNFKRPLRIKNLTVNEVDV